MTNETPTNDASANDRSSNHDASLNDNTTTMEQLKVMLRAFVDDRNWQSFHNPKNLAMSLAIETGELMEHFQWLTLDEAAAVKNDPTKKHDAGEELADCLAYIISIANAMDIDLSETLRKKMIRNVQKYPVADAARFGKE